MPQQYPFSAIVGCAADSLDDMGLALVLTTISPEIGGVLIRGEKGTAKSTAVRALAAVLPPIEVYAADRFSCDPGDPAALSPDGPFPAGAPTLTRPVRLAELPVGATEDRVLGSIQLERALTQGAVEFEPGLLARAHRGILYVDEVNLLHDHLVDVLLDAAAMGWVTVERDGVSVEHAARFVLIGTMNPEEGELRPQLLDRFGLTVEVTAPRNPRLRAEVVRRRMAYDAGPAAFAARYHAADAALSDRIQAARDRVPEVRLSSAALLKIAEVCAAFEVDGLRADIVTARTAVTHAAWAGPDVSRADIRQAALLALPHRRRRKPFDAPGMDEELLDQILGDDEPAPDPPEDSDPGEHSDPGDEGAPGDDSGSSDDSGLSDDSGSGLDRGSSGDSSPGADRGAADNSADAEARPDDKSADDNPAGQNTAHGEQAESSGPQPNAAGADAPGHTVPAGAPYRPRLLTVAGLGEGMSGRRSRAIARDGHRVGARPAHGSPGSLHLVETLLAAAGQQPARRLAAAGQPPARATERVPGRPLLRREDLRIAVREGREANLILFCVDASGSMAARTRMTQVKTAILSLLLDAYRRRDKVALVTFRGRGAELTLPPTNSADIAAARLDALPAGGRTPLAEGLLEAGRVLLRERQRDPRLRPLLVVVTDGRATGGPDAVARSLAAAGRVAALGVSSVVIDSETGPLRLGLAGLLAAHLGAEHLPVAAVSAGDLTASVQHRTLAGRAVADPRAPVRPSHQPVLRTKGAA